MLVAAFAGLDLMKRAYAHAVRRALPLLFLRRCLPAQPCAAAMSERFSFALKAQDGAARTGEITTPRGIVRTPAFMPVGTGATVKAMFPEDVQASRRRHHPRQHLSSDAAARRRAHRRLGGLASIHALGRADPHRFRRLSGHVAGEAQAHRRATASPSSRISTAPRVALTPGARHRGAMPARRRHPDGARRMHAVSGDARGGAKPRWSCRCAGPRRCKQAFAEPGRRPARLCSASCRAASIPDLREQMRCER